MRDFNLLLFNNHYTYRSGEKLTPARHWEFQIKTILSTVDVYMKMVDSQTEIYILLVDATIIKVMVL